MKMNQLCWFQVFSWVLVTKTEIQRSAAFLCTRVIILTNRSFSSTAQSFKINRIFVILKDVRPQRRRRLVVIFTSSLVDLNTAQLIFLYFNLRQTESVFRCWNKKETTHRRWNGSSQTKQTNAFYREAERMWQILQSGRERRVDAGEIELQSPV